VEKEQFKIEEYFHKNRDLLEDLIPTSTRRYQLFVLVTNIIGDLDECKASSEQLFTEQNARLVSLLQDKLKNPGMPSFTQSTLPIVSSPDLFSI